MDVYGTSDKLVVVYIAKTGHLLGAATRLGSAGDKAPAAEMIAGKAMLVARPSADFDNPRQYTSIPAARLATAVVDYSEEALRAPTQFVFDKESVATPVAKVHSVAITLPDGATNAYLEVTLEDSIDQAPEILLRADGTRRDIEVEVAAKAKLMDSVPCSRLQVGINEVLLAGDRLAVVLAVAGHTLHFDDNVKVVAPS